MTICNRYAQEEVLKIIIQHNITLTQIARYLGCTVQVLHYQLNEAKHFDSDFEKDIYRYFAKMGITKNQKEEIKMIADQLLEHAALTNHQLALLTRSVKDIIEDKNITEDERTRALTRVRAFRSEVMDSLNHLETLINGSKELNAIYNLTR